MSFQEQHYQTLIKLVTRQLSLQTNKVLKETMASHSRDAQC